MQSGEALKVVGPLGNGFPKGEKKAFLIGGGIGIPPMLELAKELVDTCAIPYSSMNQPMAFVPRTLSEAQLRHLQELQNKV